MKRERAAGESCKVCIYFSDFTDTEEADECNGYCTVDFVKGRDNPYGGHWTNDKEWCEEFEAGKPLWVRSEESGSNHWNGSPEDDPGLRQETKSASGGRP